MLYISLNPVYRINDHEDTLERMLAVLRFTFSKDIKHIVRRFHPSPDNLNSSTNRLLAARQTMQAVQFRSRRELSHALGRYSDFL